MPVIESAQNPQVKLLQSLATAKVRQEQGLFLVEGVHAVAELIATGWTPEIGCFCPALLANEDLAARLEATSRTFLEMSERAFKAISDTVTPQGIAAAVRVPRGRVRDLPPGPGVFLVVHEGRDPGNMGTMIRTADAAGAAGVIAVDDCVDFFSPKVVRATAGSLFHVGLAACTSADFLTWAAETGTTLLATHLHARQTPAEVTFPERVALLIGSEAHGLPEALLTASDIQVTIPMPGRAESLNAAVAAGIMLYETIRQR